MIAAVTTLLVTLPLVGTAAAAGAQTPSEWTTYAMVGTHNAHFPSDFPAVSWTFVTPGADRIDRRIVRSNTEIRDLVGFPIGAAVVDGKVFASNDNGYVYCLDAMTGKLLWSRYLYNQIMSTPIVVKTDAGEMVVAGIGNSDFTYSHARKFGVANAQVIRGTGISGVAALDAKIGEIVWFQPTEGQDMPTPAYVSGKLIFGNGDGHVYALDAKDGKIVWKTPIHSFVSMSSATPVAEGRIVVMGGTQPSRIYGVNSTDGKLLWSFEPKDVFSSSAGDGTWAGHGSVAVGQIEIHSQGQAEGMSSSQELAVNAKTGEILWSRVLGSGKVPPRNKDAVPVIADGVIYTGSPVTHHEYAVSLASGKVLWDVAMPAGMKAAPMVVGEAVIQPLGNGEIHALDRKTGRTLHVYHGKHGGFGPQNGVLVGKTYFIGSNAGYFQAIPLAELIGTAGGH
ncbi:MAG: hypothetical protein EPN72_00210 [Nevskiaceae bacterium]|nr:MAG: hypothetical protein EPN63_09995 [Nevskiaceae bacterium]TBR75157.1 MAG: hypothetical protein EPN72_00210 [Nevskiaceae bacterium]